MAARGRTRPLLSLWHDCAMVEEAPLERTEHGLVPGGRGWFVVNARDAAWVTKPGRGACCFFEGFEDKAEVLPLLPDDGSRWVFACGDEVRAARRTPDFDQALGAAAHCADLLIERGANPPRFALSAERADHGSHCKGPQPPVRPTQEMQRPMSKMCHCLAGSRWWIVTRSGQNGNVRTNRSVDFGV